MNDTLLNILIEAGVLIFLGLVYYFWQRSRIIRNDLFETYSQLDKFFYDIEEFLKEDDNLNKYPKLSEQILEMKNFLDEKQLDRIYSHLSELNRSLPEMILKDIESLKEKIEFHLDK